MRALVCAVVVIEVQTQIKHFRSSSECECLRRAANSDSAFVTFAKAVLGDALMMRVRRAAEHVSRDSENQRWIVRESVGHCGLIPEE